MTVFEPDQLMNIIPLREPFQQTVLMFVYSPGKVVCDANVEYVVILIGHHINVIIIHGGIHDGS